MMLSSVFSQAKSTVKYNETSELLQHSKVRNAVSTPVEVDSAGWKSDASVYQRLVQVSDKIQKWKTQLEMESRVKDRKLGEALQTIEKLRTNVFELRAENETLGHKLREEIGNRDGMIQRLAATREMCVGLKNFAGHVEMRLNQCETEKLELSTMVQKNTQQCRDLCDKFSHLTLKSNDNKALLESKWAVECSRRDAHEEELACQLSKIQTELDEERLKCLKKEESLTDLQRQHLEKEDELSQLQKEYLDQNENFLKLTNAFAENQRCITSLSKKCDENETLIESLMQEGLELKNLADLLRQEIDDKKTIIASLENECSEKTKTVSELQLKVEDLHLRLESLQNKFDETVTQMKTELEETKNAGEQELVTLKEDCDREMTTAIDKLKLKVEEMSLALEKCKQQFSDLFEERRMLEVKLDCREDECSKSLRQFLELLEICKEIDDVCVKERDRLMVLLSYCVSQIEEGKTEGWKFWYELEGDVSLSLQQKMNQVQRELKVTEDDDLHAAEDQLSNEKSTKTRSKVEKVADLYHQFSGVVFDALKKAATKLEYELKEKSDLREEYNQKLQNLQTEVQKLCKERESDGEALLLQKELNVQADKKTEALKSELEALLSEKQMTYAQLENSRLEICSLKMNMEKLYGSLKETDETRRNLDCQVEKEKQSKVSMEQTFRHQLTEANKEKEELKKLCDQLKTEKDEAETQMKVMASELSTSLTSYKNGCDDVVARKNKEIEDLKLDFAAENQILSLKLKELQLDFGKSKMECERLSVQLKAAVASQTVTTTPVAKTLAVTPVGKGHEARDTTRYKEKSFEGNTGKPFKAMTPLKPKNDTPTAMCTKPTPAPAVKRTPNVALKPTPTMTVTPIAGKKTTPQVKGKKQMIFDDEKENFVSVEESELFAAHSGILRRPNSIVRKRSVMFASSQQSDDSSASELVFIPPVKSPCYRMDNRYGRKAPEKKEGRVTHKKAMVRETKPQKKQPAKEKSIAWFDSDAVFGFGPED